MKKIFLIVFIVTFFNLNLHAETDWAQEIKYAQLGACETNNLAFNAARFTKMPLNKTRDGLDLYLQLIVFLKTDGTFRMRMIEQGLGGCQTTKDGEVCSYRPYPDTKQFFEGNYIQNESSILIPNLGVITKIRDDFPWQGFNIELSSTFPYASLSTQNFLGGKIQINFNDQDINVSRICKQTLSML